MKKTIWIIIKLVVMFGGIIWMAEGIITSTDIIFIKGMVAILTISYIDDNESRGREAK